MQTTLPQFTSVSPAYGRDFLTAKAAKESWEAGQDWLINDLGNAGKYTSIRDQAPGSTVHLRFKQNRNITIFKKSLKASNHA